MEAGSCPEPCRWNELPQANVADATSTSDRIRLLFAARRLETFLETVCSGAVWISLSPKFGVNLLPLPPPPPSCPRSDQSVSPRR